MGSKKKQRVERGLGFVITLALALYGASGNPSNSSIFIVGILMAFSVCYALSNWANSTIPQGKIVRWIMVVVLAIATSGGYAWHFWPEDPDAQQNKDAFHVVPGTAFVAGSLDRSIVWVTFPCPTGECVTPSGLTFLLTVTNRKHTKAMISSFRIEVTDSEGEWHTAPQLPVHGGPVLWGFLSDADSKMVGILTLTDGFLEDKIGNISLTPGEPVKGWVLCQEPFDFAHHSIRKLRISIRDTAGSTFAQEIDWSAEQQANSLLSTMVQYTRSQKKLTDYQLIPNYYESPK